MVGELEGQDDWPEILTIRSFPNRSASHAHRVHKDNAVLVRIPLLLEVERLLHLPRYEAGDNQQFRRKELHSTLA
jgi:hypothetical protein